MSRLINTRMHHDTGIPGDYCELSESPSSGERQDCHIWRPSPGRTYKKRAYEEYDPATECVDRMEK